jgi:hypothetical protein
MSEECKYGIYASSAKSVCDIYRMHIGTCILKKHEGHELPHPIQRNLKLRVLAH